MLIDLITYPCAFFGGWHLFNFICFSFGLQGREKNIKTGLMYLLVSIIFTFIAFYF